MNFKEEIFKTIQTMVDKAVANCRVDRTFKSVIKEIKPKGKGYVILDETGTPRIVKCCIPGLELRKMQNVWVKVPMGDMRNMHICGVV